MKHKIFWEEKIIGWLIRSKLSIGILYLSRLLLTKKRKKKNRRVELIYIHKEK